MKRTGLSLLAGGCLLLGAGTASAGDVNCAQVNKYLGTGRTPQEVAETMIVSEADVKKCQAQGSAQGAAQPSGNPPAAGASGSSSGAGAEGTKK